MNFAGSFLTVTVTIGEMAMDNPHRFWDRLAKRYAKSPVKDEASYQAKLDKTREFLTPESRVLEIGCGTGSTAIRLAPGVKDYLATDISGNMLEIARDKAESIRTLRFEQAMLEQVAMPEGGFDAVLAHSILHLLPEKEAAVAQIFARLAPGGVFISSTTCLGKGGVLKGIIWAGSRVGLLPLVRFFDRDALEEAIKAAGFEIEYSWQPDPKAAVFLIARKPA